MSAVRGVSFELRAGRILGIVGESGCGKTSLSRALIRLLPAVAGDVVFRGRAIGSMNTAELRQVRREAQYIFQDPLAALSPRRTIGQTLLEPLVLHGIGSAAERPARIARCLETVGLDEVVLGRLPHQLSGGQRQRVALARALVADPSLIIADEPMSSLDVSVQARIIRLLLDVRAARGVAMILISHDLAVIRQLADDVAVMYLGELVETAPAADLFRAPAHPYTRALLDSVPVADPSVRTRPSWLNGEPPSPLTPPAGCVFHTRCPQATARCATVTPDMHRIAAPPSNPLSHAARCHLWKP